MDYLSPFVFLISAGGRKAEPILRETRTRARTAGWTVNQGWKLPAEPWSLSGEDLCRWGRIGGIRSAQAALLAAVRGVALIVLLPPQWNRAQTDLFLADLERVAPVALLEEPPLRVPLAGAHEQLLRMIGNGMTIDEIARRLHSSSRTVHRRMADVRRALGVRTTAEAVMTLPYWPRETPAPPGPRSTPR